MAIFALQVLRASTDILMEFEMSLIGSSRVWTRIAENARLIGNENILSVFLFHCIVVRTEEKKISSRKSERPLQMQFS